MRRLIASLFLFVYLFANTELHELVKIGAFVMHYQEHLSEDKDLTLVKFVNIHYFNGDLVDEDHDKDMQLPFKVADCNHAVPFHTIPWPQGFFVLFPGDSIESIALPLYDQTALPSSHSADIWQPPKSC